MRAALIIAAMLLALAGCAKQAESSVSAGREFKVERLFTADGCTVYRFGDGGIFRYFTNCHGSTSWQESCGKNCSRNISVEGGAQ